MLAFLDPFNPPAGDPFLLWDGPGIAIGVCSKAEDVLIADRTDRLLSCVPIDGEVLGVLDELIQTMNALDVATAGQLGQHNGAVRSAVMQVVRVVSGGLIVSSASIELDPLQPSTNEYSDGRFNHLVQLLRAEPTAFNLLV